MPRVRRGAPRQRAHRGPHDVRERFEGALVGRGEASLAATILARGDVGCCDIVAAVKEWSWVWERLPRPSRSMTRAVRLCCEVLTTDGARTALLFKREALPLLLVPLRR